MNTRFLIFLAIVAIIVTALVIFDLRREDPWNSDVFFGQNDESSIYVMTASEVNV